MSITKNQLKRYFALDNCFSNTGREYTFKDLLNVCNNILVSADPKSSGISVRTLRSDISFMKSEEGYSAPIVCYKGIRGDCYKYDDSKYSIRNRILNEDEIQSLSLIVAKLSQFEGLANLECLDIFKEKIKDYSCLTDSKTILGFEENIYLKGRSLISELYDSISYKKLLTVDYLPYNNIAIKFSISPYYLKQYNNRWFLFGYDSNTNKITNLALDRIENIKEIKGKYIENNAVDFDEYFEDIIGVTRKTDDKVETVILKINIKLWPYIFTKPLHGSQKVIEKTNEHIKIKLELILNYELESIILSHCEKIEVVEPLILKNKIISRIKEISRIYK